MKVHATPTKQMVVAFFDSQGMVNTNYGPRGTTAIANLIVGALQIYLKAFRPKGPEMASGEWFLHQEYFFLFPKLIRELAGITMTQEHFKNKWEGVLRALSKDDFVRAFTI